MRSNKEKKDLTIVRILVCFFVGGAAVFAWRVHTTPAGVPTSHFSSEDYARSACKRALEARMHDPSSAEWVNFENWEIVPTGARNVRQVHATFRATNGFGAKRLGSAVCNASYFEKLDQWYVATVKTVE